MEKIKIGFIGAGNMATSIIGGLASDSDRYLIYAHDPDDNKLALLETDYAVQACHSNNQLLENVDVVVLSIKPQMMETVLNPLSDAYDKNKPLIVSIAAGIKSEQILSWLKSDQAACIRVMPNTPALVQTGASGLFAVNCDEQQKQLAENIMNAVGISLWLDDEALIDTVTAVSGSGPAYFFYLMEALYDSAINNGLNSKQANLLTLQTALGSAILAANSDVDFKTLRQRVTSPGGTTEAAINVFKSNEFSSLVDSAVTRAAVRSKELSKSK